MQNEIEVVVIGKTGLLQEGLRALLMSVPAIEKRYFIETIPSEGLDNLLNTPALVIVLPSGSTCDLAAELNCLKNHWPHSSYLIMVKDDSAQVTLQNAGFSEVLIEGYPAAELLDVIEQLILRQHQGETK